MKPNLFHVLIILLNFACVQDNQFELPNTATEDPEINGTIIEIGVLQSILAQAQAAGQLDYTFAQDSDNYALGYVVSTDEAGNFFEELIVQDKPENPTAGIKVLIDENPLFTQFEFGRKVYIKLAGLTVGISNGVLAIGVGGSNFINKISAPKLGETMLRSATVATIVPKELALADFSDAWENVFIRLTDVQFSRNLVLGERPLTFAGEANDEFDGERLLESCLGGGVIVSTSTFADFKGLLLPKGQGVLDGILTRDFFDEFYTININEPVNIQFGDVSERCDPDFLACTTPSSPESILFTENFETYTSIEQLEAARWTVVNTSGGELIWDMGSFSGNNYAQITAFNSGEEEIATWLITPAIDMDQNTGQELSFALQASYDNGSALSVLYATNFTDDPTLANWSLLDVTVPIGPADSFGDFVNVGPINISCLTGIVHFAFLYSGSESGPSTRYHLDNVVLKGD